MNSNASAMRSAVSTLEKNGQIIILEIGRFIPETHYPPGRTWVNSV